jgi:transposase-like protein
MSKKRRRFSADFKFKVALEAAKGTKTLNELSSEYDVHPNQISAWKRELLDSGDTLFSSKNARQQREQEALQAELYEQIGRLKMELEWLKKKLPDQSQADPPPDALDGLAGYLSQAQDKHTCSRP